MPAKQCDNPAAVALAVARRTKTPKQAETSAEEVSAIAYLCFDRARIGYLPSRLRQFMIPLETERSFADSVFRLAADQTKY